MGYTVNAHSKYRLPIRTVYVNVLRCFHLICSSYKFIGLDFFFPGTYYLIVSLAEEARRRAKQILFVLYRIDRCFLRHTQPSIKLLIVLY